MISKATQRTILRWIHLVVVIPILGYIYGDPHDVQQYAGGTRYLFLPILMFSGYCMYAGVVFAVIGVALWLAGFRFFGFGVALLTQVVWFTVWKIWSAVQVRRSTSTNAH